MTLKTHTLFLSFFLTAFIAVGQNNEIKKITVRKETKLSKAVFDNVDARLLAIDKYGNVVPHAITSFRLSYFSGKKKLKVFKSSTALLTKQMLDELKDLKKAKEIHFTHITAEDEFGNTITLPDFVEMHFPQCPQIKNVPY